MNLGLAICWVIFLSFVRWIGGNTRGNLHGCENKGVAGKAIRKNMKTKGQ
jgi:hypothetical protein